VPGPTAAGVRALAEDDVGGGGLHGAGSVPQLVGRRHLLRVTVAGPLKAKPQQRPGG
jgi:hypothetical protein